ncbi:TIGR02186 family protein [Jiella sp. M17.18]|uniref:TIGR02186 family protein n=1 Tax=Jiella sp. M17.18 TaxID=3234247 RepID=UPI0034E00794
MRRQVAHSRRRADGGQAGRLASSIAAALVALALLAGPGTRDALAAGGDETFRIGLSTDTISITSEFTGARLVVFGALDNADPQILRQQRYDIVVVLMGPRRPVIVRRKERTLGIWINRGSENFNAAPASYALAATRPLADIARAELRGRLSIGVDDIQLSTYAKDAKGRDLPRSPEQPNRDDFATALRRIRQSSGLYDQTIGSVQFVSPTLFRADLQLPANLPVGRHTAQAFLFRNGVFIREDTAPLIVVKTGFEAAISDFAVHNGIVYGLFAVVLAIFTGWFGRLVFKRD